MKIKYLVIPLIIINIILSARWVIDGNIFFHTDIARDFLLMEDIVENKHFALIGPRSGAIPGLFHGPLWLYLNIPAFLLGRGNPVFVGWFWILLFIASLLTIYFAGKKLFNEETGLLSALLLSAVTILNIRALFNPYGALILTPLFFYFFVNYINYKKLKELIFSILILGVIIQFQMAFGVPVAILAIIYLLHFLYKSKKLWHLTSLIVIIFPLSSHILFEVRNNFLQTKSVISYLGGGQNHGKLDLNLIQLITQRIREMFLDGLGSITQNNLYITMLLLLVMVITFLKIIKHKPSEKRKYILVAYFYFGFWLMAIFFKGPLWNYYYLPFIPLLILVFVSLKNLLNSTFFYALFFLIYCINMQVAIKDILHYEPDASKQDVSTWKFNEMVAKNIFTGHENEFGYFIFTPDLYGYSPRFAMNFYQERQKDKKVYPYQKKAVTYLIIAPPPAYGKDPNSIWYQKNTNSKLWKNNDIRIERNPDSTISFDNGFTIEKYNLSNEEIAKDPNPYLIKDIFFR